MKTLSYPFTLPFVLLAALGACSDPSPPAADMDAQTEGTAEVPTPASTSSAPLDDGAQAGDALTVTGWRGIRLGEEPGAAAEQLGFADDGSYTDVCRIWTSASIPGVYLIVEQFEKGPPVVARISASDGSPIKTAKGIGAGSPEADVRAAYEPLGEQPHKYEEAPAKNLVWGPEGSASALRFEIGTDGLVNVLHAGISPTLGYVEGCS